MNKEKKVIVVFTVIILFLCSLLLYITITYDLTCGYKGNLSPSNRL